MSGALRIIPEGNAAGSCGVKLNVREPDYVLERGAFKGRAAVVTLGCAKNQVDSEVMLGVLRNSGFEIVKDLEVADIAIVNTCGFLDSSVKESIDCVLDIAKLKTSARLRKLIVAGCMVERYKGDIQSALPEVDRFIGVDDILKVGDIASDSPVEVMLDQAARPYFIYDESMPRQLASPLHSAYVKISEGCNRPCTFCIIPRLRGAIRSRSLDSVVSEVVSLGAQGVREVNLVAQDLTAYGRDLKGPDLTDLLIAMDKTRAVDWIRLLYAYPVGIDERLLKTIVSLPSVCNYFDFPLQHSSERVLKTMQRPIGKYSARRIIEFIRTTAPEIQLRTTFIVGFPGETEEDVRDLEEFISAGHFLNVGIFTYSREEGTPSYDMDGQIPEKEKTERRDRLMKAQQEAAQKKLSEYVGSTIDVLIEGLHEETDLLVTGRAAFQAPEVDGTVIINDFGDPQQDDEQYNVPVGEIRKVTITEVAGYDLVGTLRPSDTAA